MRTKTLFIIVGSFSILTLLAVVGFTLWQREKTMSRVQTQTPAPSPSQAYHQQEAIKPSLPAISDGKATTTSLTQPKIISTPEWKTYQNNEFGFQVKYPPELSGYGEADSSIRLGNGGIDFFPGLDPLGDRCGSYKACRSSQDPKVRSESYEFSGRTFWLTDAGRTPDTCRSPSGSVQTQREIGKVTFMRIEIPGTVAQAGGIRYVGEHQGICYHLVYSSGRQDSKWKELESTIARFEQIVSTFELLPATLNRQGNH